MNLVAKPVMDELRGEPEEISESVDPLNQIKRLL
jgi:hypothetical protein